MKEFTNHAPGARGINLTDGTTKWIEPGETVELDPKSILGDVPNLGKRGKSDDSGSADLSALTAQVAELTKQVEELTTANKALDKDKTELTKQVEELTKPAK